MLEQADAVGGRVRTDLVDGFRCDRGFQLLNPSYPEARRTLDLAALDLRPLPGAVVIASRAGRRVLGDPRRTPLALLPAALIGDLTAAGGPREKLAFARWALRSARRSPADLLAAPDEPWGTALVRLGIDGRLRRTVLEPFLAGVLGEADGSTSRRFVELLLRSFVLGRPAVPAAGMQAIPDQLAAALPPGTVHCGVRVDSIGGHGDGATAASRTASTRHVRTSGGTVAARVVVVAVDPTGAAALAGTAEARMYPLTTFWHTCAEPPPGRGGALHLDGDRRGPVVNSVVLSAAAPTYAPAGRALIATTMLGLPASDPASADSEPGVRRQLARIYGVDTSSWELVTQHAIERALTPMAPPLDLRRAVSLADGLFVAGDHRDSASSQGALVSGRRAADAVLASLGISVAPRGALDALSGTRAQAH